MNTSVFPATASVSDLQRNYAGLIKKAKSSGQPIVVMKKNKPEAILLSPKSYEDMKKQIREQEEKLVLEAIAHFEKEKKAGRLLVGHKAEDLFT